MMTREQLQQRHADDVKKVMATESGRRFVWGILDQAGVFRISFTGEVSSTIFNEGNRNSGLALFNDVLKFCPELYLKMAAEAEKDREANHGNTTPESDPE
ncbi:Bbp19 family protein [Serratia sp. IR-2025]